MKKNLEKFKKLTKLSLTLKKEAFTTSKYHGDQCFVPVLMAIPIL